MSTPISKIPPETPEPTKNAAVPFAVGPVGQNNYAEFRYYPPNQPTITLLDYFAAAALQGIMSGNYHLDAWEKSHLAYEMAEQMLERRIVRLKTK